MKNWSSARTFADLVDLNVRFLRGELTETPYHLGPVDDETIPLLSRLVRVNQLGFVSIAGQPAVRLSGKGGGHNYVIEQKSFIEGLLLKSRAHCFINFMRHNKDVYVFVKDPLSGRTLFNNFPTENYLVKRIKHFASSSERTKASWQDDISSVIGDDLHLSHDFRRYPQLQAMIVNKCVEVSMAGKRWVHGLVEHALLAFLVDTCAT